ncbi:hypothetical protein SEVIR_9G195200v4 [Setaria viridis]
MALPSRLLAGVLLILAVALVCSSAELWSTGGPGQDRDANAPQLPRPPRFGLHQDRRQVSPVPPLRPLGLREPVAAPPPSAAGNSTGQYKAIPPVAPSAATTTAAAVPVAVASAV